MTPDDDRADDRHTHGAADGVSVTIIGVPLDLGSENLGVDIGPDALRQNKIADKLTRSGFSVTDAGNIKSANRVVLERGDPALPYADEIVRVSELAAETVHAALRSGDKVVALGGDHSACLGVFAGAAAAAKDDSSSLGLIYLDAHGDLNTPESSLSHNIHGMHLAALLGIGAPELVNVYGQGAKLDKANLLHIGGSDFDAAELELIRREGLDTFTMFDFMSHGFAPLIKKIDELCARVDKVWVSVDLDVIDSVYAPGVGIPNRGGFTYREIAAITEYIGKHCTVVGLDMVEYNPLKDQNSATAELAIEIIAKLLGSNYSWYTTYMERQG